MVGVEDFMYLYIHLILEHDSAQADITSKVLWSVQIQGVISWMSLNLGVALSLSLSLSLVLFSLSQLLLPTSILTLPLISYDP